MGKRGNIVDSVDNENIDWLMSETKTIKSDLKALIIDDTLIPSTVITATPPTADFFQFFANHRKL